MAEPVKTPVTVEELLISSLRADPCAGKLLIENRVITQEELMQKICEERATYQRAAEFHTAISIGRLVFAERECLPLFGMVVLYGITAMG